MHNCSFKEIWQTQFLYNYNLIAGPLVITKATIKINMFFFHCQLSCCVSKQTQTQIISSVVLTVSVPSLRPRPLKSYIIIFL